MEQVPRGDRRQLVDAANKNLSVRNQCELLSVNRSSLYCKLNPPSVSDLELLNEIRDIWERYPFYGYRRITVELKSMGYNVNRKRVHRLMSEGGIKALYPGPNTSRRNRKHAVHPYLLREQKITKPNQAWMVDITYLKLRTGFVYLVAFIDVFSRYVIAWEISNTLETEFCITALKNALKTGAPEIINSDQGCQFTSDAWVRFLKDNDIRISMTGKGRCLDNVYIERFWRSVKQEEFYINEYEGIQELIAAIDAYIEFYNHTRWHQSLGYRRPAEVYFGGANDKEPMDMWTSPSDQPAPFGTCGQVMDNADALPTT